MDITESTHGSVLVLSPRGRLDSIGAPELERSVRAKLEAGHRRLVIDLGALDYVSSAGLRVLMIAGKVLKAERGRMALCRLKVPVQEVFRVSGFDRIFTILPSLEASIERIGAEP
jgi:anti-anti-sigma factor